jgi:hypothetical protein
VKGDLKWLDQQVLIHLILVALYLLVKYMNYTSDSRAGVHYISPSQKDHNTNRVFDLVERPKAMSNSPITGVVEKGTFILLS